MPGKNDVASEAVPQADPVWIAERYVDAFNERDLEAMLAVMDENVVSYPSPLFKLRRHFGHAGVRAWWAAMMSGGEDYTVEVLETRLIGPDRVAVFGEIHSGEDVLSPWAVVVQIRNELIVESRSYLSDRKLFDELQLLDEPLTI